MNIFIFIFSLLILNWFSFFNLPAGYLAFSIYFQVLRDTIPFFNSFFINTPYGWTSLLIFELVIICLLVFFFQIFSKIIPIIQQALEYCSKSLMNLEKGYLTIIIIISTFVLETIFLSGSLLFYVYYSSSSGFRTIGDFGILTILTLDGLIHLFFLALLSISWIQNEKQRIFYFLFFTFLMVTIITIIFPPVSNPTFPYRLILYVFLFGTPLAIVSFTGIIRIIQRNNLLRSRIVVNMTKFPLSLNLKK